MVMAMSDEYVDPSGNTEAFRSFAQSPEAEAAPSRLPLIIGIAVLAAILIALVAFLAAG
ncbi:hypothetical protein GCM10023170_003290 [Phytohabitans houttuyneae]|uniref:Uncharacterized protein n=2 Tax=Phytohabitans houttuyneae TaxID=1076126 RepID=A0A6V8K8R3_9ACTN|nr:hypothetical protein Phou_028680 [Phytohabitans houttuyneae]